jgi:endo-1,4-beta-xylanase
LHREASRFARSELDVADEKAPADEVVRDRLVADAYSRFLDAALDEPAVKMVVTWGLSDRHSWIVRKETHESKWRADSLPSRRPGPCLSMPI